MVKDNSPFVGIAGTIGGISIAIVAVILIFASHQAWISILVVVALAIMGICLGHQQKQALLGEKAKPAKQKPAKRKK